MKKTRKETLVVLLATVICGALLVGCLSDEPVAAPTVTAAATTTPTPIPTLTPAEESEKYSRELEPLMDHYKKGLSDWMELTEAMRINSSGTGFDPAWKADVAPVLVEVLAVGKEIRELQPPPCLGKYYLILSEAIGHIDLAALEYATTLDTFDPYLLLQATEELKLGAIALEAARAEMQTAPCGQGGK